MSSKKVSGKTHSKEQLDNRANQLNPKGKSHSQVHNAQRRRKGQIWSDWAPDYIEYDD